MASVYSQRKCPAEIRPVLGAGVSVSGCDARLFIRFSVLLGDDVHLLRYFNVKRGDRPFEIEWPIFPAPGLADIGELPVRHAARNGLSD